ncbi:uncharacterized protein [Rutidosis leptorrhynchoides]|uniref:uncharacterized protein n=1 Tax=Rutidosis leptorrhynchoides TaxID=125765 RepID=UPI003A9A141E
MRQMNFSDKWISWIRGCLSSGRSSILIRGSPMNEFSLEKGLRQGDHLPPFLFLIVSETLNIMMKDVVSLGHYKGVSVGCDLIHLSHLQFADDVLFLEEWSESNTTNLIHILTWFGMAFGLKIHFSKSKIFDLCVPEPRITNMTRLLNCASGSFPFTYLGLPVGDNMNRIGAWETVFNKLSEKLSLWKSKVLSIGGRLTLTKSVLGSLPLFYMSLFRASIGVIKKLESIRMRFLWGLNSDSGMTWVSWNQTLRSKTFGGLGIESLRAKNLSLLAKWFWRLKNEGSLWVKVIKSIHGTFGKAETLDRALRCASVRDRLLNVGSSVSVTNCWIRPPIRLVANELDELSQLVATVTLDSSKADSRNWKFDNNGQFSTKKLTCLIDEKTISAGTNTSETIRNNLVSKKIEVFVWRARKKRISALIELDKRGIDLHSVRCPLCDDDLETVDRSLILCKHAFEVWSKVFEWWGMNVSSSLSVNEIFLGNSSVAMSDIGAKICGSSGNNELPINGDESDLDNDGDGSDSVRKTSKNQAAKTATQVDLRAVTGGDTAAILQPAGFLKKRARKQQQIRPNWVCFTRQKQQEKAAKQEIKGTVWVSSLQQKTSRFNGGLEAEFGGETTTGE